MYNDFGPSRRLESHSFGPRGHHGHHGPHGGHHGHHGPHGGHHGRPHPHWEFSGPGRSHGPPHSFGPPHSRFGPHHRGPPERSYFGSFHQSCSPSQQNRSSSPFQRHRFQHHPRSGSPHRFESLSLRGRRGRGFENRREGSGSGGERPALPGRSRTAPPQGRDFASNTRDCCCNKRN